MSELIKEIERQLGYDMIEEGNMTAHDVLEIIKNYKQPQLNEDQKVVLEWLKNDFHSYGGEVALFEAVADLTKIHRTFQELSKAYISLDVEQQGQVLAAFARWGLEQDKVQ